MRLEPHRADAYRQNVAGIEHLQERFHQHLFIAHRGHRQRLPESHFQCRRQTVQPAVIVTLMKNQVDAILQVGGIGDGGQHALHDATP